MKPQYQMSGLDGLTMGQYSTISGFFVLTNARNCVCHLIKSEHQCLRCSTLASFALHFPEIHKFVSEALEAANESE